MPFRTEAIKNDGVLNALIDRDAVGKSYPAVEGTYPAVEAFFHGIYFCGAAEE